MSSREVAIRASRMDSISGFRWAALTAVLAIVSGIEALLDLAVLHQHLRLHIGADIDGNDRRAFVCLEQDRRARGGFARVALVQHEPVGVMEVARDRLALQAIELLADLAGARARELPFLEVAMEGDLENFPSPWISARAQAR